MISEVVNFATSLVGFFISVYLGVSLEDMREGSLEPMELSENVK
jgi:hypothetical protein